MSGSTTSFVAARLLLPDYLVQGQDTTISCPLYQSGSIVEVDSGTVSVYDASNTAVVDGVSATIDGNGVASYTVLGSLTATKTRGMGWRVEWSLTVDGSTTVYRNSAGLMKSRLFPVVTDADLYRRESALDPNGDAPVSALTTFQDKLDEAFVTLEGKLAGKGNLPHLVMEPTALREPLLFLTLHLIFQDFRTRLNETWKEKADDYRDQFKASWDGLAFEYDSTDSGQSDGRRKRSATPSLWMGGFD